MELSQVRYFLALCEEGRFTRAARRCGIAQPSLTRAIKLLEAELGGLLFVRELSGVRPTALGQRIEPRFRAILREVAAVDGMNPKAAAPCHVNGESVNGHASQAAMNRMVAARGDSVVAPPDLQDPPRA